MYENGPIITIRINARVASEAMAFILMNLREKA
jgi:hypothetical protein